MFFINFMLLLISVLLSNCLPVTPNEDDSMIFGRLLEREETAIDDALRSVYLVLKDNSNPTYMILRFIHELRLNVLSSEPPNKNKDCAKHKNCSVDNDRENFTDLKMTSQSTVLPITRQSTPESTLLQPTTTSRTILEHQSTINTFGNTTSPSSSATPSSLSSSTTPVATTETTKATTSTTPPATSTTIPCTSTPLETTTRYIVNKTGIMPPRRRKCLLQQLGHSVRHSETKFEKRGSWLRDSKPSNISMERKRWLFQGTISHVLYEYESEKALDSQRQNLRYYLNHYASGNGLRVHDAALFYHPRGEKQFVRYDLTTEQIIILEVDNFGESDCKNSIMDINNRQIKRCAESERDAYLYGIPNNFVDFEIDEHGIWALYHYENETFLVISLMEVDTLQPIQEWEFPAIDVRNIGNAFIMCGVLHLLDNAARHQSFVNFAFDLFENIEMFINVSWVNPYNATSVVDYDAYSQRLFIYDNGRLLTNSMRTLDYLVRK